MWPLLGVGLVLAGLALRLNPLLVVVAGALATGVLAGKSFLAVIAALGHAYNGARFISVAFLVLPVVGLLERAGLQFRAQALVERLRAPSLAAILVGYLALRQLSAALGLLSIGGQANMVRPLIAPMAEAAQAAGSGRPPDEATRTSIRAYAASVDNVGAFFGEDIFVAVGSVLLIQAVLAGQGLSVQPLRVALWAIPTAIFAFVVHAVRLAVLGRRLAAAGR
ncbi:MAG TPA: DUF969 family protein [Caulobacteraceae bacterium]|nr:DUF969 family protein [Caulobacteraceae bacterium]